MKLVPVVCKNDVSTIINKIQDFLDKGSIIKGMHLVDHTDDQVVLLICDQPISKEMAEIFWTGYQTALG
jgi:hypothetical protein